MRQSAAFAYAAGSPILSLSVADGEPVIPLIAPLFFSVGMEVDEWLPVVNGGFGPYTYAVTGDDVPGLTFDGRRVTGSPTSAGVYGPLTIAVEDALEQTFSRQFRVAVGPAAVSDLVLPPVADRVVFVGDKLDETLPRARGGSGALVYGLTPALPLTVARVGRRVTGRFRLGDFGKHTYSYFVSDADDTLKKSDFTVDVRVLRRDPVPVVAGERFVESRIALYVPPVGTEGQAGYRRGFAWWNGENPITVADVDGDDVTFQPGEIAGLSDYVVEMQSTEPVRVLLEGADPLFRAWLVSGPSMRDAVVVFLIRDGGDADWDTDVRYIGRVGEVIYDLTRGEFVLEVDAEILVPSQSGVTRMSNESQRSIYPTDEIYKHLPELPGKTEVWPG